MSALEAPWNDLLAAAREVAARAYAPYSGFRVGAAALLTDGRVVSGCNVENASYGLTLCAECGLVSSLHGGAAHDGSVWITHVVCVGAAAGTEVTQAPFVAPCGRCRQLLLEHAAPQAHILDESGPRLLAALLPGAFTAADIG